MISIYRGLAHVCKGTLSWRLQRKWRQFKRNRRLTWCKSQIGNRDNIVITIQSGVRIRLYFDSELSKYIYCDTFEWQERQFMNRFLRPGDVFVDIGANIGLFTLIAAHRVGNAGRVYAFEPCMETYLRLLNNVQLNHLSNASCHHMALSDNTGQLEMNISLDGFDAYNSMAQPIAGTSFSFENVNATTWDNFAQENNLVGRVTMMKIDVEGWEFRVLAGGCETLSRKDAPVLQVEFSEKASRSAGSSCASLYHQLEELGYQMFVHDARSRKLVYDPLRPSYSYLNLFAVKHPEQISSRLESRSRLRWLC